MPLIDTPDGHYTHAITTANEGDGNDVVYDNWIVPGQKTPVWDKFSYEASLGTVPPPSAPSPPVSTPSPAPSPSLPGGLRLIQVTNADVGVLLNRMYAYWSNAWISSDGIAYIFAGHLDNRPRFFAVYLASGVVQRLGAMLPYTGTGEGWYWDSAGWIYVIDGARLLRVNPFTGVVRAVLDISGTHPGCDLWQAHSADDGRTHCATVRRIVPEEKYPYLGTVIWRDAAVAGVGTPTGGSIGGRMDYYPAEHVLDESQITPDGEYLIIHEGDDNRIIHLPSGRDRWITDLEGAVGHSDCGPGYVVGEDDQLGACVKWDLNAWTKTTLFETWNMGHVSVRGGRCLLSNDIHLSLVGLNGEGVTPLIQHGMVGNDYDHQVMANLDPTGRVACYVSNHGGDRMDVFLLVLP